MKDNITETSSTSSKNLYTIGGWAAIVQLVSIIVLLIVEIVLGPKPVAAEEFFNIYQNSFLEAMLRGDFLLLFLIGAYLGTFPALYMALKNINPVAVFFATLFTFITVTIAFATEPTFTLLHLGKQFTAATNEILRGQIISAADAIIVADNMWHSSGAYMSGFLLQGAGVIISLVMLRSKDFNKVTAFSGLLGNAIDLGQHMLHPFMPGISVVMHPIMGIFYFIWFPMLARDLFCLAKKSQRGILG